MELSAYLFIALVYSVFAANTTSYWAATQYWGLRLTYNKATLSKIIAEPSRMVYMKKIDVNGLQSAITTKHRKIRGHVRFAINIPILLAGILLFPWYVPLVTLFGVLVMKNTIRQFLPEPKSTEYLELILSELDEEAKIFNRKLRYEDRNENYFFIHELQLISGVNLIEVPSIHLHPQPKSQDAVPEAH